MNNTSMHLSWRDRLWAPALVVGLLAGITLDRARWQQAATDVAPYQARVAAAIAEIPLHISDRDGDWYGTDSPVPPAASRLLHTTNIVSRVYEELATGQRVNFLIVHCADARDILGHYPPVCYINNGWSQVFAAPREWKVDDDLVIHGMEYEFTSDRLDRMGTITVENFMILPNGTTCRDMDGVDAVARDRRQRYYGAAQVQFVANSNMLPGQRLEFLRLFVRTNRSLIDRIRRGVSS